MVDLDELATEYADECARQGHAGFCIRTNEDGSVRLVGLRLPPSLVANMLRTAAHGYEEQVHEGKVN